MIFKRKRYKVSHKVDEQNTTSAKKIATPLRRNGVVVSRQYGSKSLKEA